jgi:predicted transcriptional regulator
MVTLDASGSSATEDRTINLAQTPEVMDALTARRLRILLAIRGGASTLRQLAHQLGISGRAVQDHVRELGQLGLVSDRRWRGTMASGACWSPSGLVLSLDLGERRPADEPMTAP